MADLSLAKQCDIILKTEEVWADSQNQTDMYTADAETIKALASQQANRVQLISSLQNPELEDDVVKVVWIDNCGDSLDEAVQDVCDFDGEAAGLNSKNFQLTAEKSFSFSVDENDLLRNRYSFDEYVARQLLSKTKLMDEFLNAQSLLFLSANAGYNKNAGDYTLNGSTLEVPTSDYNLDLLVKMVVDAKINKIGDPFLIDSGTLYQQYLKAELDARNSDGDGNNQRKMLFPTSFDLVGFPTAPVTDSSFLVNPGSYAFAHRNYNPSEPTTFNPTNGWTQRFSIPSNNIPGLSYDIYYKYECSGKRFKHVWYGTVNYGFLLNPVGCDIQVDAGPPIVNDQVSGILSYTKVADS